MLVSDLSDFLNGLDGADLVVGHHDADEGGIGADGSLHVLRADIALRGGLDIGDFKAQALQRSHAVHDGVVLKRTGDEVLLVLACLGKGSALDRPVVSLRAAAGEEDLRRGSMDGLGHLRAAGVHELLGLVANAVVAAGVAAGTAQGLDHDSQHLGCAGSRGGIVEIDDLFRRLHAAGGFIFHLKPVLSSDKIRAKRPGYSLLTLSCRGCQPHAHRATLYLYPSIPTVSI